MPGREVGNSTVIGIYGAALALGAFAISHTFSHIELPPHLIGAGHWQFLTNLSLAFSLVVFAIGLASHLAKSPTLFNLKNSLHPIAFVLESVVTLTYWPLRIFLIKLLVKDPTRKMVPIFVDMCLHLFPVLALSVDYFFFMPRWTITSENAFASCFILTLLYWFYLKQVIDFENGGEYPYMFLNTDTEAQRILIFGMIGLVGFAMFLFSKKVYDIIVHPEIEQVELEKLKKTE